MEKYIQPFIEVTKTTFRDFVGTEAEAGRPYFQQKETVNEWDISGVIGLSGEARGAVVIGLKSGLAIRMTDMLTSTKHSSVDAEVVDAVGEIINIIAGNAKRGLEEAFRLIISLPTIIEGRGHQVKWPHDQARIICIPFTVFGTETFILSVAIESLKGA